MNNSIRVAIATVLSSGALFAGSALAAPSPSPNAPTQAPTEEKESPKPKPSKSPKAKKDKNAFVECVHARAKNKAAKKDHIGNGKACKAGGVVTREE